MRLGPGVKRDKGLDRFFMGRVLPGWRRFLYLQELIRNYNFTEVFHKEL